MSQTTKSTNNHNTVSGSIHTEQTGIHYQCQSMLLLLFQIKHASDKIRSSIKTPFLEQYISAYFNDTIYQKLHVFLMIVTIIKMFHFCVCLSFAIHVQELLLAPDT